MVYGAKLIAQSLYDLDVKVIFGLPGMPVIDIAEESLKLGIRFIAFRNEQAAAYAATAYGYLTGKPGVCLCVGGPGVIHVFAGIPHAAANSWPLLVLGGSSETHNAGKGAFQEMDSINLISPHAKLAVRPPYAHMVPTFIKDAYRTAFFGRPGPTFVDLPADLILGTYDVDRQKLSPIKEVPLPAAPEHKVKQIAQALKSAKSPLVVIGKGAAYAQAERQIRTLIDQTGLLFLASPMGKGVVPDSSPYNVSSARSAAMKECDVVLVLGGRLNWVLSFGQPPKWNPAAKIMQVDICADELGRNAGDISLSLVGDIALVVDQLVSQLGDWRWEGQSSAFYKNVQASKSKNEEKAAKKAAVDKIPMTYEKIFDTIKHTLDSLSAPENGEIIYISEGANAMDISRSMFPMEHPRTKLDAGTYATMGVGLGYSIAAYAAYNFPQPEGSNGSKGRKKIVAIEGDSAIGMSAMELETMSRYQMDIMVFVLNNSGLYRGDTDSAEEWQALQKVSVAGGPGGRGKSLSSMSLGYQTDYQKISEMCGGVGFVAHTPEELKNATQEAYKARVPAVVNIIVESGADKEIDFSWLDMAPPKKQQKL